MTKHEKIEILKQALKECLQKEMNDINEFTKFEDLNIDSLDSVEIQMWIEDNKKIPVSDPKGTIKTVADFLTLLP
jgi:acyl carrier protein